MQHHAQDDCHTTGWVLVATVAEVEVEAGTKEGGRPGPAVRKDTMLHNSKASAKPEFPRLSAKPEPKKTCKPQAGKHVLESCILKTNSQAQLSLALKDAAHSSKCLQCNVVQ